MKIITRFSPLLLLLLFACQAGLAQAPRMFLVHEDVLHPAMATEYLAACKEMKDLLEQAGEDQWYWSSSMTNEFRVRHVSEIGSMADLDEVHNHWNKRKEMLGEEKFNELMSRMQQCYRQHNNSVVVLRSELSHMPEGDIDITTPGQNFRHFQMISFADTDYKKAEKLVKKVRRVHEENESTFYYRVYEYAMGGTMPQMIVVASGTDAAEYEARRLQIRKDLQPHLKPLMEELMPLVIDYSEERGEMLPAISLMPAEVIAED